MQDIYNLSGLVTI